MNDKDQLADQLHRAWAGGAWHGPAIAEALAGISPQQASKAPIPGAHSIWEIVLHLGTWVSVVRRRIGDDPVADVPADVDWPVPNRQHAPTKADWDAALAALASERARLLEALGQLSDDALRTPPPGQGFTRAELLLGLLQHDAYHGGQISLLAKALYATN